jgi:hypothetical protein
MSTDTVNHILTEHTTTDLLELAPTGLEELIKKLSSSSSECNPTGTVHHVNIHMMDQLMEPLKTETQESSSSESSTGKHQPTSGRNGTEESPDTDTVPDTEEPTTNTEQLKLVVDGFHKLNQISDTSSSELNLTGIVHHAQLDTEVELHTLLLT